MLNKVYSSNLTCSMKYFQRITFHFMFIWETDSQVGKIPNNSNQKSMLAVFWKRIVAILNNTSIVL